MKLSISDKQPSESEILPKARIAASFRSSFKFAEWKVC